MKLSEIIQLMQSSRTYQDWYKNRILVSMHKKSFKEYWYKDIVMSGVMWNIITSFKQ